MLMLLAIDTATQTLSLALHDGQRIRAELTWDTENAHTIELAPAIVELLHRIGIEPRALTRIAVAQGPGSFSGLRIGIGLAKGLAMALAVPLIAVPTLEIVAAAQPPFNGNLLAVAQAGRGRVCAGRFTYENGEWMASDQAEIVAWDRLIEMLDASTTWLIAGELDNTARTIIAASRKLLRIAPAHLALRRAAVLADLAWTRRETAGGPVAVIPIYVNQPGVPHP